MTILISDLYWKKVFIEPSVLLENFGVEFNSVHTSIVEIFESLVFSLGRERVEAMWNKTLHAPEIRSEILSLNLKTPNQQMSGIKNVAIKISNVVFDHFNKERFTEFKKVPSFDPSFFRKNENIGYTMIENWVGSLPSSEMLHLFNITRMNLYFDIFIAMANKKRYEDIPMLLISEEDMCRMSPIGYVLNLTAHYNNLHLFYALIDNGYIFKDPFKMHSSWERSFPFCSLLPAVGRYSFKEFLISIKKNKCIEMLEYCRANEQLRSCVQKGFLGDTSLLD